MRLSPDLTPSGATTGLALFAARKERLSRGELAEMLGIDWRRASWIEVRDEDYRRERWADRAHRLLAEANLQPAAQGQANDCSAVGTNAGISKAHVADGLDNFLQEAIAELGRVSAARPHLSTEQVKALLSSFVAGLTHRAARVLGGLRS